MGGGEEGEWVLAWGIGPGHAVEGSLWEVQFREGYLGGIVRCFCQTEWILGVKEDEMEN